MFNVMKKVVISWNYIYLQTLYVCWMYGLFDRAWASFCGTDNLYYYGERYYINANGTYGTSTPALLL